MSRSVSIATVVDMKNRLLGLYFALPLIMRKRGRQVFLASISLPIISSIYHRLYYAVIEEKLHASLKGLEIETYNVCNLRCVMCPYPDMTREKKLMSMELFKKIIDDAATSGIAEISLTVYSEPLLDPLLFERIKYVKSKGLKALFSSNATLLTKDKIDALLGSGVDLIIFSFDGATKQVYESIRVGADFEKTKGNIIGLFEERNRRELQEPFILITFAAQKNNYHEIKQFRSFWEQFADRVNVSEVDDRRVEGLLPAKLKMEVKPRPLYPCRRLFEVMTVMSNGKVALCCRDFDGSVILGDLNKQTIREVVDSPQYEKIREIHLKGQGDKIKLCRDIQCPTMYRDGAYLWWRPWAIPFA